MSGGLILFRAAMAAVLAVVGVAVAAPAGASNDPKFNEQWGLSLIGAPAAWEVGTGAGMTIAVVDTGVDFGHPDLQGKLLPGRNFVTPGASAQDDNGHGTHVAGIAAAATGNGVGVAGTAPGARILPVKVLGANGKGTVEAISEGIIWAANNGAQVINLSLGPNAVVATLFESGLEGAVNEAWSKGAVVVIAAGNNLLFGSSYSTVNAVVVTATTRKDDLASSYASPVGSAKWGIAAPGGAGVLNPDADNILSTYWSEGRSTYDYLAGTSMATPHVAGAAAVLRGQGLSPQQTVDRLLGTAKDLGAAGRDSTYGAGRLNLACAAGRCGGSATTTGSAGAGSTTASPGTQPASNTSGSGGSSGAGATSPGPAGSDASPGGTGGDAPVPSEGGGTGSTATGPAGTRSRTTGSRAPGSNPPAGAAPSVSPSPAPSTAVSGDPAAVSDPGTPAPEPGAAADLGDMASGDLGPNLSSAAGRAVAEESRPSPVLAGAAGGLLLLVAFSGLGLRRRRQPRPD